MGKILLRIAYIEDEPDIQKIAKISLEKFGSHQVSLFQNAEEALAGIEAVGPDLILLDIMLPGMDGRDLYGKLRELSSIRDVPIIFITAKANYAKDPGELMDLGAIGVLEKPFNPISLTESIEEMWRKHVQRS